MKFNKFSLRHWVILLYSVAILLLALPLRLIRKLLHKKVVIVFYGHKLNGNLLPLFRHWSDNPDIDCYYLTMDSGYAAELASRSIKTLKSTNFRDVCKLAMADAFISDHGLHHFSLLRSLTDMKFIHVLHGIPFKGYNQDDFKHLHAHDQIWVSSEALRDMHIKRFGFTPNQVKVTGFARIEDVALYQKQAAKLKRRYGLSTAKKTILIAPTWKQDDSSRSPIPFDLTLETFIQSILKASKTPAQIIFRSHLNAGSEAGQLNMPDVHFLPYSENPVAEEFLAISDVLITDWSSIGLDFLATDRPVIYLDVKAPFKKGFSVDGSYRAGAVVGSKVELATAVKLAVDAPNKFEANYKKQIARSKDLSFGDTLDGRILKRSDDELTKLLGQDINQKAKGKTG